MITTYQQMPKMATQNKPHPTKGEKDTITNRLEVKAKTTLTVLWNDLPSWQQDNQHIHSGYRPASNSYSKSFASLTHLHNESVNIYTHLIGALLALLAGLYTYSALRPRYEQATQQDVLVFLCFFGGAVACLGMSATYHTISNHSERVAGLGNKLDYLGYGPHTLEITKAACTDGRKGSSCSSGAASYPLSIMVLGAIWSWSGCIGRWLVISLGFARVPFQSMVTQCAVWRSISVIASLPLSFGLA